MEIAERESERWRLRALENLSPKWQTDKQTLWLLELLTEPNSSLISFFWSLRMYLSTEFVDELDGWKVVEDLVRCSKLSDSVVEGYLLRRDGLNFSRRFFGMKLDAKLWQWPKGKSKFPPNLFLSSAIEMARAAAEAAVTAPAVLHHLSLAWPRPRPWPPPEDDDELRGLEDGFWLLWLAMRLAAWLDLVTTVFHRFIVIVIWNNIKLARFVLKL